MDSKKPVSKNHPATKATISGDVNREQMDKAVSFMSYLGEFDPSLSGRADHTKEDFYSDLVRCLLKVDSISRGKVTCSFSFAPSVVNGYKGLNGGMVAVAERVAVACARTVVAEDKELVTGDVSLSYLSAASMNSELIVEASLLRSGRNITVVSTEFRIKNTKKLVYTSHTNFFHIWSSSKLSPEAHNN